MSMLPNIRDLDIEHPHEMGEATRQNKSMPNGMIEWQSIPGVKDYPSCICNPTQNDPDK